MPKLNVKRSIHIRASKEKVKNFVADFHNWKLWSPWLIAEPEANVIVADDGKEYSWEGNRVGAGEMKVTNVSKNEVNYDLTFLKPWKSEAKTDFYMQEQDGGTHLTWTMDSSLPFFLFWMKKKTEAFIGMDYERGLLMLKEYLETGKVNSTIEIKGKEQFPGTKFVGITASGSFEEMKNDMSQAFTQLGKDLAGTGLLKDMAFTQYHKFDFVKDKINYTCCVGVEDFPEQLPEDWKTGELPAMEVHTVRHIGPYEHLGNAWTTAQMMLRNKEFKHQKRIDPFEIYVNDPATTPENELVTDICFATK